MHDEGHVERGFLNLDVEVAEGDRVRRRGARKREKPSRKTRPDAPAHKEQW
jgi:hypothetical protein